MRTLLHCAAAGIWLAVSVVSASAFTFPEINPEGGYDLTLYPTTDNTPQGARANVGPAVPLPVFVDPGYLVLLWQGNPANPADFANRLNWSDVVWFSQVPAGTEPYPEFMHSAVQLFTGVSGSVGPWMPDLDTVLAAPHRFMLADPEGNPTTYIAGLNQYLVWNEIPEPAAAELLVLLGAALYVGRRPAKAALA